MTIDRVNLNRALAKAIAYKQCGQEAKARKWAIQVIRELAMIELIDVDHYTASLKVEC
jgi:hypothetical protein